MALSPLHRAWRRLPQQARRSALLRAATALAPRPDPAPPPVTGGVVLAGELARASGLGEGARQLQAGLAALGIPAWTSLADAPPGAALLLHVNAPQLPAALLRLGRAAIRGRRIVAFWNWELPIAPPDWRRAIPFVHEIWTPSRFTAAALEPLLPGRVRAVPYPLALRPPAPAPMDRAALGLPPDALVTLTVFGLASSFARKNPLAAIAAHQAAFGPDPRHLLILKLTDPTHFPADFASLEAATANHPNIRLDTRTLPRPELHALMAAADIVLSPHRSEGFGLVPAEAMFLARPILATDWSATAEFLDATVAAPIPYRLIPVHDPRGTYALPGAHWADPDIPAMAALLRSLAADPARRAQLGQAAHTRATAQFGPTPLAAALRSLGLL